MIGWRRLITAIIGGLLVTATVHAGMTPLFQRDVGRVQSSCACGLTELQHTNLFSPNNCPNAAELDLWSVVFLPEVTVDISRTTDIPHPQILTNGPGSLNLCLSALIGLGLCSSAHWVKRISFGFVPEWYHNCGPFQIGHSFAVTPESLCNTMVCCLVQPVCTVEDSFPQYRLGTVTSLWQKSQFTPTVLVPRGPPNMS